MVTSKKGLKPNKRPVKDSKQANQWEATEQQERWLVNYLNPGSDTWGNSYQSAMKAGYSESYARRMFSESMGIEWVKQAKNIIRLNPEHLKQALIKIIQTGDKNSDRIAAIKLMGVDLGMFVERKEEKITYIEQAISELE